MSETALLLRALAFSARKHRMQRRKGVDALPYINHPIEVADLLANAGGIDDTTVLVAAVLHDTIEDTETTGAELERIFGPEVRRLVEAVSDDKSLPKAQRKRLQVEHAPKLPVEAKWIKLADLACNVRDITADPPAQWPIERRREYLAWAERVASGCRGSNERLERAFDETLAEGRRLLANAQ